MSKCYINEEVWLLCSESPDTPVKLKNTHAPNVIMHGFLLGTEKDNAFGFNIGPFGKCNRRGEDCFSYIQRQLTEWYDLPETNVLISGARPLDINSKCFCKSGLGTIHIFLSKEAALNSGIQPDFILPSELDSFLTTGLLVFGLGKGIPALATASKTAFQVGKTVVDFTAGLGSVIWTMDKVQDKITGAMLYLGADPSLTGDVMDFLDNLAGVFKNYTDGNAYLSLALAAGDLAAYGDVKPNGRLYKSDTEAKTSTSKERVKFEDRIDRKSKTKLKKNVIIEGEHGYEFETDHLGRVIETRAPKLVLGEGKRSAYKQRKVGWNDRLSNDQGGHGIGAQFDAPGGYENLSSMDKTINLSTYKKYEILWADTIKNGGEVTEFKLRQVYEDNIYRPKEYELNYTINDKKKFVIIENKSGGK